MKNDALLCLQNALLNSHILWIAASDVEAGLELSCSRPESTSEGSPHQPLLDPGTAGRSRYGAIALPSPCFQEL